MDRAFADDLYPQLMEKPVWKRFQYGAICSTPMVGDARIMGPIYGKSSSKT
jgi:hypothetical protein